MSACQQADERLSDLGFLADEYLPDLLCDGMNLLEHGSKGKGGKVGEIEAGWQACSQLLRVGRQEVIKTASASAFVSVLSGFYSRTFELASFCAENAMATGFYTHIDCTRHEMGAWHPECPGRLHAIEDQLIASSLEMYLDRRDAPLASLEAIARVHSESMIALVRDRSAELAASGRSYFAIDGDTALNASSWNAALRSAGAALAATDAVMAGELDNAFCATRPPGHHACPTVSMGFCLFNNVAIAVRHALEFHGLERVAVVDFDVHHGNGTEEALADDPRVMMVSFFQHPLYPYCGTEPKSKLSMNVPVPAYTGGDVVRQLVLERWLPALHAHRPQMIFVSAGFDAHREDDLGQMALVEADYAWITQQVRRVAEQHAQGRIVSCLEGGYNPSALARSVVAHVKALACLDGS